MSTPIVPQYRQAIRVIATGTLKQWRRQMWNGGKPAATDLGKITAIDAELERRRNR